MTGNVSLEFPFHIAWSWGPFGKNHIHLKGTDRTICGMKEFENQYTVYITQDLPHNDRCLRCFKLIN